MSMIEMDGQAFSDLLEHHTETVKDLTRKLVKAETDAEQARGLRSDVRAAEQAYEGARNEIQQMRKRMELMENLYNFLKDTLPEPEFKATMEKAEQHGAIPF